MGIFSKPEIIIFKESNSAEEHLAKLEELLPRATGKVKENIQKEIILTKAGIDGEKKVLYELKNSNMDLVKKCWRDTGERKDYAARYEELIDLVEAEEMEIIEKEEATVDAKTVVVESVAGEQKVMPQIEEEPAMMNPTILEEVQKEIPATTGKIVCPVCGGELVLRTARRGANTGKQFYGCSSFPRCRYILNIAENLEKSDTSHSKK